MYGIRGGGIVERKEYFLIWVGTRRDRDLEKYKKIKASFKDNLKDKEESKLRIRFKYGWKL